MRRFSSVMRSRYSVRRAPSARSSRVRKIPGYQARVQCTKGVIFDRRQGFLVYPPQSLQCPDVIPKIGHPRHRTKSCSIAPDFADYLLFKLKFNDISFVAAKNHYQCPTLLLADLFFHCVHLWVVGFDSDLA